MRTRGLINDRKITMWRLLCAKQTIWPLAMLATLLLVCVALPSPSQGDPLDYNPFGSVGFEGVFRRAEGRVGFLQIPGLAGTLSDLVTDLGLPVDMRSYRGLMSIRPLEHHNIRIYGSFPENYRGERILPRTLVTRNVTYPAGSLIKSELRTGQFGAGYDLDFLIGPRWFGGLNGDLRYIDLRIKMGPSENNFEDTLTIDELTPCLGVHGQGAFPLGSRATGGLYGRLTYGITPNYLSYVDLHLGATMSLRASQTLFLLAKVGYEHESMLNEDDAAGGAGRRMEFKRDGIVFSVEASF